MVITVVQGAFLPVPPLLGGAVEKMWHLLAGEFAARGHRVVHLSRSYGDLPDGEVKDGVTHRRVKGFDTPKSLWMLKLLDLVYSRNCAAVLEEADIIVTNTFWLPMFPSAHRKGAVYVDVQRMPKGQMRLYRRAARLRANSSAVERAICKEAPAMSSRVTMIPNLLPFPPIPREKVRAHSERSRVLLYVGRVQTEKGIHLLIDAFAEIEPAVRRDWRLHIVGPWSIVEGGGGERYLDQLKAAATDLPVTFFGPVHDVLALARHYDDAPIFVYPSLAAKGESFGLAPLEAMAHGAVPVVSKLDCFQDFITHDVNGVIFDHTKATARAELACVLQRLIVNTECCRKLSEEAWKANVTHAPQKIAGLFLDDFEKVVAERRGSCSRVPSVIARSFPPTS